MLSDLFGPFADTLFEHLGASPIMVRYRDTTIISPTPIVSHEGVQVAGEASRLIQSESFSTYTVSIPTDTLAAIFAGGTGENTISAAIAPNKPWFLSFDNGTTWTRFRTMGEAEKEVYRVKIQLVLAI